MDNFKEKTGYSKEYWRMHYAGLAMQGIIGKAYVKGSYQDFAEIAVEMADTLIK